MRPTLRNLTCLYCLLSSSYLFAASGSIASDTIIAPPNITVSCEVFDPSLLAYGEADVSGVACLDTTLIFTDYSQFDSICLNGIISRTFQAVLCDGNVLEAMQHITVEYNQFYFVRFPSDVNVTQCNSQMQYGEPIFYSEDCELMATTYEDQVFGIDPTACYKIERTWTIINWCTYDPLLPLVYIPNPTPNAIPNHPANLPGPTVSAPGTAVPWAATIVKITPSDTAATNYSIFWNASANGYQYKQIIRIIDSAPPIFQDCPLPGKEYCDQSTNDAQLWNNAAFWDQQNQQHDLGEAAVDLSIVATDSCTVQWTTVYYILYLDIDDDGITETEIKSQLSQPPGVVPFQGGTTFDNRPVPSNQLYRFTLDWKPEGNSRKAYVRWDWADQPIVPYDTLIQGVSPQLPYGTHKIKWFAEDGCGNQSICEYSFTVKDCKKPTVVCLNGLSVNITQTGLITLWASDFSIRRGQSYSNQSARICH
ncbi:MAG: hypothetical protein IPL65_12655 [Lewinellaceae bacterium]|nr:hypothetical protein [Lewinellaceae bacterium]